MSSTRLYLKEGIDPQDTLRRLRAAGTEATNIAGRSMGFGSDVMRDEYLRWAEATEDMLRGLTLDPDVPAMLITSRYALIRAIGPESARPWPLVDAEIRTQTQQLHRLADDLEQRITIARSDRHLVVLDTSALLEYLLPEQVPWPKLLGTEQVRLVVPLRVVEELDDHKRSQRSGLAKRARRLLQQLEAGVEAAGRSVDLSAAVSWEVLPAPSPRRRPEDADEEILGVGKDLQVLGAPAVSLATDDAGMRLRARSLRISLVEVPLRFHRQHE
jgi:hypothetical protein